MMAIVTVARMLLVGRVLGRFLRTWRDLLIMVT